jgi:hypothetical protein
VRLVGQLECREFAPKALEAFEVKVDIGRAGLFRGRTWLYWNDSRPLVEKHAAAAKCGVVVKA